MDKVLGIDFTQSFQREGRVPDLQKLFPVGALRPLREQRWPR
jgi:hypothetical protein